MTGVALIQSTSSFLIIFGVIVSIGLTPLFIFLSKKWRIMSRVYEPKLHPDSIPLLGGPAVYITLVGGTLALGSYKSLTLLLCALPIFLVGVVDDIKSLNARHKFFAHILATLAWLAIQPRGTLALEQMGLPSYLAFSLTAFWIVVLTNAFNLIDGMDGLCGGLILFSSFALTFFVSDLAQAQLLILLGSAISGFLAYNLPPAKIYIGDAGSTSSGFILACIVSTLKLPAGNPASLLAPLLLLCLPQADTALAMIRRFRHGRNLFSGDLDHIHHKLLRLGLTVRQSVTVLYSVLIFAAIAAYGAWMLPALQASFVLFLATSALAGVLVFVYVLDRALVRQGFMSQQSLRARKRNFIRELVRPSHKKAS